MHRELVDMWIIFKHFQTKWDTKYRTRKQIPIDLLDRQIQIDDFNLIWNLSTSRFVNFSFKNLKSIDDFIDENGEKYVSLKGRKTINVSATEAQMVH